MTAVAGEPIAAELIAPDGAALAATAITALFVPGDRPERFAKAAAAGADIVIIDLEDAVAAEARADALASVLRALGPDGENGGLRALVRINATGSPSYDAEVRALLALAATPDHGLLGLVVPKAENAEHLRHLRERMPENLALVPLIESALGLVNALEIAMVPEVTRLAFGAIDFALDIDAAADDRYLDYARAHLVVNSRAAGIAPPLDSPCTDIRDAERVGASARLGRDFGFSGKLCIHPAQLAAVHAAFAPTAEDVRWALSVVGAEGGATQVDGRMVDRPVTERAKRILHRAGKEQQ